ncbi:SGNH/GDSL hydrolase family protein [Shimia sp.]|uniref:SGNH/GDSL hydrolase family protein n=1 Tax=Shimia sp. TaxID=1954381 RepID=UPI0035690ADA
MKPAPDLVLRPLLAPLLLAQGLWVRTRAMRLPEPAGPRSGGPEGDGGNGSGLRLLILGDSSAAGVGAGSQGAALGAQLADELSGDGPLCWHLEAATGATTRDTLLALPRLPQRQFDLALLVHGVNDTTRFVSPSQFRSRQNALIEALRSRHSVRRFILSGVPPMQQFPLLPQPLRWVLGCHAGRLDRELAELAKGRPDIAHLALDLPYEPHLVAADGYHPSEAAYSLWVAQLARLIRDQPG